LITFFLTTPYKREEVNSCKFQTFQISKLHTAEVPNPYLFGWGPKTSLGEELGEEHPHVSDNHDAW